MYDTTHLAESALVLAVKAGNATLVASILEYNPNMNINPSVVEGGAYTVMHHAAQYGYLDCMKAIVQAAPEKDKLKILQAYGPNQWTPLHEAADSNQAEVVAWLISQGVDANPYAKTNSSNYSTPLSLASGNINLSIIKNLVKEIKKLPNASDLLNEVLDDEQLSPLGIVMYYRNLTTTKNPESYDETVGFLISEGAARSYANWNTFLQEKKLLQIIKMVPPEQDNGLGALEVYGYAVLQHIQKNNFFSLLLPDAARDELTSLLKSLRNTDGGALPETSILLTKLEAKILRAMHVWKVEGRQWDLLKGVLVNGMFSVSSEDKSLESFQKKLTKIEELGKEAFTEQDITLVLAAADNSLEHMKMICEKQIEILEQSEQQELNTVSAKQENEEQEIELSHYNTTTKKFETPSQESDAAKTVDNDNNVNQNNQTTEASSSSGQTPVNSNNELEKTKFVLFSNRKSSSPLSLQEEKTGTELQERGRTKKPQFGGNTSDEEG